MTTEKLGQLDLVFVVDNTGSMGPYINAVKTKILEIIRTIKKEELCKRLRVGLVSYRDHPPEESSYVTQKFELSSDTSSIEQNIMRMSADGGGDGPEAVCDALHVANRMEFLNESAKVIVFVGDAPPHGVEPSGDSFPKGCPDGHSWEKEAKTAYDKGIVIHSVGCYPEIDGYQNAVVTYQKIAELSEGKFFPLEKADLLVQLITGIAVEEIDKIAIQQSVLEELGVSMDEFSEDEEIDEAQIATMAAKMRDRGMSKRAVRHAAPSAAGASEEVVQEAEAVSEDDIREAVRQLRKKSKK
ncbi:MAG: vWA domain-containing protein [Candidatus Thorarchaeota archaeon]